MTDAREILPGVTILPYANLEIPFDQGASHGIFIRLSGNPNIGSNMNIGSIIKIDAATFQLNLMSIPEFELPEYEPFDYSEIFSSYEDAINAARRFLNSKKRISDEVRIATTKLVGTIIRQHPENPYLAYVALHTQCRLSTQHGMHELANALHLEIDEFCKKHNLQKEED